MFFEGSEKKIEVIFSKQIPSLRSLPEETWELLVEKSQAKILSKISNDKITAYLLSESSLFVYDHYLVMITCGTTQLVRAAEHLLGQFQQKDIEAFFYERKNEILPQAQSSDFFEDIRFLQTLFQGEALRYGLEDEHHLYLFSSAKDFNPEAGDHTMEVLMHGIDPKVMDMFRNCSDCDHLTLRKESGIEDIIQGSVDDFIFQPMGYSLNAVDNDKYFTIHITPETMGSYSSFETNAFGGADQLVWAQKVLNVFQPLSFDLMLFNDEPLQLPTFKNYQLKRNFKKDIQGYSTQYLSFYRPTGELEPQIIKEIP